MRVVIWLFGVELIEALSPQRARNAIRALVELAPETAHVRNAQGVTVEISVGDEARPVQARLVYAIVRSR